MKRSLLAIVGLSKCGTTALASYLVNHHAVELLVPGVKEPYLFAEHDYVPPESLRALALVPGPPRWMLDASAGYATNAIALDRMYVSDPTVIACFRNPLERAYSAYRMHKHYVIQDRVVLEEIGARYKFEGADRIDPAMATETILLLQWPRPVRPTMAGYVELEGKRLGRSTFLERITYELQFFASRRVWSFRSVLSESFFTYPAKLLLERFAGKLTFVSVSKISNDLALRGRFLAAVLGAPVDATPELPSSFSLADLPLDEEPPDFRSPAFDFMRDAFRYDLGAFEGLLDKYGVDRSFLDFEELRRFL
jgi:hypothetical protein